MKKENIYLSTIAADAAKVAKEYGFGLEIAEYCTAWNLDDKFPETDAMVHEKLTGIRKSVFHGPFNELFPCAIDPRQRLWRLTVTGRQSGLLKNMALRRS